MNLRAENKICPLNIDPTQLPALSWEIPGLLRGTNQISYRIQISLNNSLQPALYDSGTIQSSQSICVIPTLLLRALTKYYWGVIITTNNGIYTSETATFETGPSIFGSSHWLSFKGYARRNFLLNRPYDRARLYLTTKGTYERPPDNNGVCCQECFGMARSPYGYSILLNGQKVNSGLNPIIDDSRHTLWYVTYDVTTYLIPGQNVLGLALGEDSEIRFMLYIFAGNNIVETISSDGSYLGAPQRWIPNTGMVAGSVISANRYQGLTYDANYEIPDWSTISYQPTTWLPIGLENQLNLQQTAYTVTASDQTTTPNWSPMSLSAVEPYSTYVDLGYLSDSTGITPKWLSFDLGSPQVISTITLYPSWPLNNNYGYGYPVRFRIDVSGQSNYSSYITIYDATESDQVIPTDPFVIISSDRVNSYRYLRIYVTKINSIFSLARVRIGAIQATALDSIEGYGWSIQNIGDPALHSSINNANRNGYHSALSSTNTTKWLQLDFSVPTSFDTIVIYPAQPMNWSPNNNFGLPRSYTLLVSNDGNTYTSLLSNQTINSIVTTPLTHIIPVTQARYLKMIATDLYQRSDGLYLFALANLKAYLTPSRPVKPSLIDHISVIQELKPISYTTYSTSTVYDFGINISGWSSGTLCGIAGSQIKLVHGEQLTNGHVDTTQIIAPQTETVTLGNSPIFFQPSFIYHGFRYIEVFGSVMDLTAYQVASNLKPKGKFWTSDSQINAIFQMILQTRINNFHAIPEDCPTREKRGWMADAFLSAETALMTFDADHFYQQFMYAIANTQQPSGSVADISPTEIGSSWTIANDPAWGLSVIYFPYAHYRTYGDLRVLQRNYSTMKNYLSYLQNNCSQGNLLSSPNRQWGSDFGAIVGTPNTLFLTAMWYQALIQMGEMAGWIGLLTDQSNYNQQADLVRNTYNSNYLTSSGYGTQFANSISLVTGLCPQSAANSVLQALETDISVSNNGRWDGGIQGTKYIADALRLNLLPELAYTFFKKNDGSYSYLKMYFDGPGTIWETWAGTGSRDHPAFGSIGGYLYQAFAGVRTLSAGYKTFQIQPQHPAALQTIRATIPTPYGLLEVFSNLGTPYSLAVKIPNGTIATIAVKSTSPTTVQESGVAINSPYIQFIEYASGYSYYQVMSGYYLFTST